MNGGVLRATASIWFCKRWDPVLSVTWGDWGGSLDLRTNRNRTAVGNVTNAVDPDRDRIC